MRSDLCPLTCGVSDGTRTRDIQDHNLTLYQLNYTHHCREPAQRCMLGQRAATSILAARRLLVRIGGRIDCPRCVFPTFKIGHDLRDLAGRRSRLSHECGTSVELQFED